MEKIPYITPALKVTSIIAERMVAQSARIVNEDANQEYGMDVKSGRHTYNVWNDDWSR